MFISSTDYKPQFFSYNSVVLDKFLLPLQMYII